MLRAVFYFLKGLVIKLNLEKKKNIIVELMKDPIYKPMKLKELCMLLDIPKEKRDEFKLLLDELCKEGRIGVSPRGKYGKPELYTLTGVFQSNARGFGFVTLEGREQDIFIPADRIGEALNGDKVRITIEKEGGEKRAEGRIIKVLEHANTEIVGIYSKNKNFGFVIPDNQRILKDIFIPAGKDKKALNGDKVVVKLVNYGDKKSKPEGVITEVLGNIKDKGVDILSLVKSYDIPEYFPEEVEKELKKIPDSVEFEQVEGRLDLRNVQMVTIDGDDAKDLDDAVSLTYHEDKEMYELGVHIADVSEYVKEKSPLDKEALARGTSVYLTDRVIPMLPKKLSNGICSLNQGEDRLALSCIMWINKKGEIVDHKIAETIIHVDRRMSYKNVDAIITKNDARRKEQFSEFVPMFMQMKELSAILRNRRKLRGGIDFDFPETRITLDAKGKPIKIEAAEINDANRLIEDFMLAANETVAEEFYWRELPFLYRTHEAPEPDKIRELAAFAGGLGFTLRQPKDEHVHPKQIQELLKKIESDPAEAVIERMTLRSMKQARYTTECSGHFGLAAPYYTHFTSPIRRYPDLQIHRIIKESLHDGGLSKKRIMHCEELLPDVAVKSSQLERRAEEAERECTKMKMCEYMSKHIGEEFDGIISGVTAFGLYVELENTCEGMVHVTTLTDDYYIYDEQKLEMRGEHTFKTYSLGQKVHIVVSGADKLLRTIDFRIVKQKVAE